MCNKRDDCDDGSDEDHTMCSMLGTCTAGYWKCPGQWQCRSEHLKCDGKLHCRDKSDEDPVMCTQWNCTEGYWKCQDGLQCIPKVRVCDGYNWPTYGCRDGSDEDPAMCTRWNCNAGGEKTLDCNGCDLTKCADNLQCINRGAICDNEFDCKDRSDELCYDECHKTALKTGEIDIVKRCPGHLGRCLSVKQYCDGIAQCPDASDETHAGCTCEDWGLISCSIDENQINCLHNNWMPAKTSSASSTTIECFDSLYYNTQMEIRQDNTGLFY